mgnify:CR=1 FL=1
MTNVLAWAAAVTAVLTAGALLYRYVFRPAWKFIRAVQLFLSDWNGSAARPGVKKRPGVLERLDRIEWHVGNGSQVALREVVDETQRTLDSHLREADQRDRLIAALSRRIALRGDDWTENRDNEE